MGEYTKIKRLGEGTFGVIYLAKKPSNNNSDGDFVAIKRLLTEQCGRGIRHYGILCLRELQMTLTCDHPNIARAKSVHHTSPFHTLTPRKGYRTDKIYLELDLAFCDMDVLLRDHKVHMSILKDSLLQIAAGVDYMHSRGIMHRDLKPNNVLVYSSDDGMSLIFRITDLGAAKPVSYLHKYTPKQFYIEYRAPELLIKREIYDQKVDIWALGCMFAEIITNRSPFAVRRGTAESSHLLSILSVLGVTQEFDLLMRKQERAGKKTIPSSDDLKISKKE
jgi:serine/threonine protein kinase